MIERSSRVSIVAAAVMALLAACTGSTPTTEPGASVATTPLSTAGASTTVATPEPVTLSSWEHQHPANDALVERLAAEFQAQTGNTIEFEPIPYGDYFTRLGAGLEANGGPCVFKVPTPQLAEFQARGYLAPLPESVMAMTDYRETFIPAATTPQIIDGQAWGLATDVQPLVLFYNDEMFRAAGLDPTKDFETWDDFRAAAKALTTWNGDKMTQAGVDIAAAYQWWGSYPFLISEAGTVDDVTNEPIYATDAQYEVWQKMTDLVLEDRVDSAEYLAGQDKFAVGGSAMTLREYVQAATTAQTSPDLEFSLHLAPPIAEGQPFRTVLTTWTYVVNATCESPDAAWAWIQFLTSDAVERDKVVSGNAMPARLALLDDPVLRSDAQTAKVLDAVKEAVAIDSLGWDDIYGIQNGIWEAILLGGEDVKAAVEAGAAAERDLYVQKGLIAP